MVSNFKFITLFSKLDIKYNNIKLTILQIYVHCTIINSIEVCGYYYLSVMIFLTLFYYSFYTLFFLFLFYLTFLSYFFLFFIFFSSLSFLQLSHRYETIFYSLFSPENWCCQGNSSYMKGKKMSYMCALIIIIRIKTKKIILL